MRHLWIQGPRRHGEVPLPPLLLPPVGAHRGARGPYTVAAALLGALVPTALERRPDLVAAHDIEIRAAAPGLCDVVPARRRSIASHLSRAERILVPAPRRTLWIANGLAEFVRDLLAGGPGRALVVEDVHEADQTDRELLAVLLRRIDPEVLAIAVCVPAGNGAPRKDHERDQLEAALHQHAEAVPPPASAPPPRSPAVEAPGGAVVQDARGEVAELRALMDRCVREGFHHALAESGERVLRLIDPRDDPAEWWRALHATATGLGAIGREDAARALFDRARRELTDPAAQAAAAYATAMLLVRHHDPARRDPEEALAWANIAVAITSLLPDPRERAFHLGFDLNGKALVEVRRGRLAEALRLVEEAIALADRDLPPGLHPIHRMVLRANRAELVARLGDREAALADLDAVIDADPGYPDYYLDRGNLLHRLGRHADAVRDYEAAMRLSPPFPEPYYNRAEVRFAQGDHEGALADLDYVLELDPEFTDAYANRAGLLAAMGEYDRARADAELGLALDPGNAFLLCALGQVELAEGHHAEAGKALDAALDRDPGLLAAWAARAVLAYESGDPEGAVADLTRALELGEEPALRFNRALALRAAGRSAEAAADLRRAQELAPEDEDIRRELAAGSTVEPTGPAGDPRTDETFRTDETHWRF